MSTMTFDKLAYVDRLKAAGFNEPQARALADGLDQALREEVATKGDIAALRNEIGLFRVEVKSEIGELRGEMDAFKSAVKGEMDVLKSTLRGEMDALRSALRGEMDALKGELRGEMGALKSELTGEMGALKGELRGEMGGLRGGLLAAMKADKIDLLKWVFMLIVGQTALFTALKLLGR